MIQNLQTWQTNNFSQSSSPQITKIIQWNHQENMVCIFIHYPIKCPNIKNKIFISKLVNSILRNPNFPGMAEFLQSNLSGSPDRLSQINIQQTNKFKENTLKGWNRIVYKLNYLFEKEEQCKKVEEQFEQKCNKIHEKIEEYNLKYKIQNRIGYWINKLEDSLNVLLGCKTKSQVQNQRSHQNPISQIIQEIGK